MMSIATTAFVGIFFLAIPFPIIIFGAALIDLRCLDRAAAFGVKSGHGDGGQGGVSRQHPR